MAYTSHALRRIFEWSQRSWLGKASVKVVGSGRYRSPPNERPVDLVRVDARSGKTQRIDRGTIGMTLEPAPAGQRVAYLRKVGSFAMAGTQVKAIHGVQATHGLGGSDLAAGNK